VKPVNAAALAAWTSRDVSVSGTMGDAPSAPVEKGERWLAAGAEAYAAAIAEVCPSGRAQFLAVSWLLLAPHLS